MSFLSSLRSMLVPRAFAEQLAEESLQEEILPPAPPAPFDAPEPKPQSKNASLDALSPEELEELKQEIVNDVVTKIAGEEGEKLEDFLEPEVRLARSPSKNLLSLSIPSHTHNYIHTHAAHHRALRPALPQPQPGPPLFCALQRVLQVRNEGMHNYIKSAACLQHACDQKKKGTHANVHTYTHKHTRMQVRTRARRGTP